MRTAPPKDVPLVEIQYLFVNLHFISLKIEIFPFFYDESFDVPTGAGWKSGCEEKFWKEPVVYGGRFYFFIDFRFFDTSVRDLDTRPMPCQRHHLMDSDGSEWPQRAL